MEIANNILLAITAVCSVIAPILWMFVRRDIKQLEVNTNSKMDALLSVTAAAEFAKGVVKGTKDKKTEGKEK